jgi:hypothetical protein
MNKIQRIHVFNYGKHATVDSSDALLNGIRVMINLKTVIQLLVFVRFFH